MIYFGQTDYNIESMVWGINDIMWCDNDIWNDNGILWCCNVFICPLCGMLCHSKIMSQNTVCQFKN